MNRGISFIRILSTIATYGSEMIVFAFLTVLVLGFRKNRGINFFIIKIHTIKKDGIQHLTNQI